MSGRFDPYSFFGQRQHIALNAAGSELFSLISRSLDLPPAWAAMVTQESGERRLVKPGGIVEEGDSVLFVRVTPIEISFVEVGLQSKDGYRCNCSFRVQLAMIAEEGDLSSFAKRVLGSRRVVTEEILESYLRPELRAALSQSALSRDCESLVNFASTEDVVTDVTEALRRICFGAGMSIADKPVVRFSSETLEKVHLTQQRAVHRRARHDADRQLQEAIADAQNKHLDHLASLLERLKQQAKQSPDADVPTLLKTFSEEQRGALYQALFQSSQADSKTRWIVAAAGDELLFFEPEHLDEPCRRLPVEGEVGGVRSIQVAPGSPEPVLWLGAATGVYCWPVGETSPTVTYAVSQPGDVRGGFNSVATSGNRIVASHSELGIVEWSAEHPSDANRLFTDLVQPARAVRGAVALDAHFFCSVDDKVIRWHGDQSADRPDQTYAGSEAVITALCPTADDLFAANCDGEILQWPADVSDKPTRLHKGKQRPAESLWVAETKGVRRLVFADTSLEITAKVLGDTFSCAYEAGGQTIRRVEVAPDLLVATNELRDRLFCWLPNEPGRPYCSIPVSSLCGRSIQDVCLISHA